MPRLCYGWVKWGGHRATPQHRKGPEMALITTRGRVLLADLYSKGFDCTWQETGDILETLSLIARHAKTARRLSEIQCGDGIHSGEWVNAHAAWLDKRDAQVEARLLALAATLPDSVVIEMNGDPRGYVVALVVTDERGVTRRVGVD